uniref:Uncharacterized protein n=1 Tax=Avena sativa TaxID=4498 RepID=A0ACD6AGR6_AVESA
MALAQLQAQARFVGVAAGNAGVELELDDPQSRFVNRVRRRMEASAEELGAVAKVFDVPKLLRATRPEAYTPQHFAIGPYHYQRPELRDMERYKLAAAKRAEKLFAGDKKFDDLVHKFIGMQEMIRDLYNRFLDLNEQTLAWMMAIDTCFLLDFLESYHVEEATDMVSSATNWINVMVRDAMMLENQIPLFLFAGALELRQVSEEAAADAMRGVLDRFIREVCPIKTTALALAGDIAKHAHLLELLYHFLVPASAVFAEDTERDLPPLVPEELLSMDALEQQLPDYDKVKQACMQVSSLDVAPVRFIKKNLISKPMSLASSLPGRIMRKVPLLSALTPMLGKLMSSTDVEARLKGVNLGSIINSPLVQEIMIPSVTQLAGCGVRFAPAPEGMARIAFDAATATLTLPVIRLDGNTEVILRNLVAYETAAVRGPLVMARYTELMNRRAAVKARRLLKRYVFRSWRILTLLAAVVLLLMTALQTFCTVYDCKRWFGGILELPKLPAPAGAGQ